MVAPLLLGLTPLVTKLMENGLSLLGNAVLAKGKGVIEDKLGVKISEDPTPAEIFKLRELEVRHEEFLVEASLKEAELRLKDTELENTNTANARDMNKAIQMSSEASHLSKNAPYYLDGLIISMTLVMAFMLYMKGVPMENKDLANMTFGALLAMCSTILNFHRGTSASSKAKDNLISTLAGGK